MLVMNAGFSMDLSGATMSAVRVDLGWPPGPPKSGTLRVRAYGYRDASFAIPADAALEPDSEQSYRLDIELAYVGKG